MFETAIAALQRHRYSEAAQQFRSLLSRFPGERALLDRARAYLDHCDRELARQPAPPETIEERLTAATAALNNDDDARAEALARAVLSEEPRQDLGLYLMAAIAARRGSADAALSYLERAIAVSPEASAQARFDDDFVSLRSSETFKRLTEPPHHATPSGRRQRRSRG